MVAPASIGLQLWIKLVLYSFQLSMLPIIDLTTQFKIHGQPNPILFAWPPQPRQLKSKQYHAFRKGSSKSNKESCGNLKICFTDLMNHNLSWNRFLFAFFSSTINNIVQLVWWPCPLPDACSHHYWDPHHHLYDESVTNVVPVILLPV